MEEFEFKPLTQGLGFHKTKSRIDHNTETVTDTSADETVENINWSTRSMESKGVSLLEEEFSPPLPRNDFNLPLTKEKTRATVTGVNATAPTLDELIRNLEKTRLPLEKTTPAAHVELKSEKEFFATATVSWGAGLLDGMLILAMTLLAFIALLSITNVDLVGAWTNGVSPMLVAATASVLGLMGLTYYLTSRVFLGFTPGEWAYEQQLGLPDERNSTAYVLKIMFRSFLNVLTGFVLFPIISTLFGKDLLGNITGAHLYQRR